MTKVGYARVSTYKQLHNGTSLQDQISLLKSVGCKKIFAGQFTGVKKNRPAWDKCNKFLRDGDVLYIAKIDRFGRDMTNILDTVRNLTKRGIQIKVLKPHMTIDNHSMIGKITLGMFSMFSDLEHSMITNRLRTGKHYALKTRGKEALGGRPSRLSRKTDKSKKKYKNYLGICNYFVEHKHLKDKDPNYYAKKFNSTPAKLTADTFGITRQTVYNIYNSFNSKKNNHALRG